MSSPRASVALLIRCAFATVADRVANPPWALPGRCESNDDGGWVRTAPAPKSRGPARRMRRRPCAGADDANRMGLPYQEASQKEAVILPDHWLIVATVLDMVVLLVASMESGESPPVKRAFGTGIGLSANQFYARTLRRSVPYGVDCRKRARSPPYAPFCSDGIGLSVLPGALRLLGLAPMGCRRLTRSRANVTAERIILDAGCVVSAPLPALSDPPLARGHRSWGGGTFLSNPEGSPSAVRGLLAVRAHPQARIWICWRCRRFDALLRMHRSRRTRDLCDSTEPGLTI